MKHKDCEIVLEGMYTKTTERSDHIDGVSPSLAKISPLYGLSLLQYAKEHQEVRVQKQKDSFIRAQIMRQPH